MILRNIFLQAAFFAVGCSAVIAAEPNDAVKKHTEEITKAPHTYQINVSGTLDEFNTAQYIETYDKNMRLQSRFQPNKYLIIENIGDTDIVNPRIVINGRRNWFSADDILAGIFKPGMTDSEKAMAIYAFLASHQVQAHENDRRPGPEVPDDNSNPSRNDFKERADPVKAVNFYYCGGCQYEASNFVILCRLAGLPARACWLNKLNEYGSHCVAETFYDGDWHLFDPDQQTFYLDSDNTNVASYLALHKNPSLVGRSRDGGFASKGLKDRSGQYRDIYPPHIMAVEDWAATMAMTLRPGEKFIYRWDNVNKYRCGDNQRNIKPTRPEGLPPYQLANGKIIYQPRLAPTALFQKSIVSELNIETDKTTGGDVVLRPQLPGFPAFVIYRVSSPWPIVGGMVGAKFCRKAADESCRIYISVHSSDWVEVCSANQIGETEKHVAIDNVLNPKPTPAIYDYYVKFELQAKNSPADVYMTQLRIETDVQMAATSLPALSAGANKVLYRDDSKSPHAVKITHGWIEGSETVPPLPPAAPVAPRNGGKVDPASLIELKWQPANDPDGNAVTGYHIQVSPRPDMLNPVCPNFDRIISSADPQWKLPQGWFVKGRTYYWRIRAKDSWGAWSSWSEVWNFTIKK